MSDFFSSGWSVFILALTVGGLLGCLWLLMVSSRRTVMAEDNSTGHTWDTDLRELNNPLPLWWMILFVATVVFGGVYLVLYPGLGQWGGQLGWTSSSQYQREQDEAGKVLTQAYAAFAKASAADLAQQPTAMAIGERLFINHCAGCHGSDARGSKSFPDLTDTDWLYGGSPETIQETITLGRRGQMPAMAAAVGSAEDIRNLANHVLSLSGSAHNEIAAHRGREKFAACTGCHGTEGRGNQALGAPNLTDKIWLHGWGEDAIIAMINKGKVNEMPGQAGRLSPAQIHVLSAYVWSLSQAGHITP